MGFLSEGGLSLWRGARFITPQKETLRFKIGWDNYFKSVQVCTKSIVGDEKQNQMVKVFNDKNIRRKQSLRCLNNSQNSLLFI